MTIDIRLISFRTLGFCSVILFLMACDSTVKISEKVIPGEVNGMESSSLTVYGNARTDARPTGMGQVFQAPEGHNFLRRVGFLIYPPIYPRNSRLETQKTTRMLIRMYLSEWEGAKPSADPIWQSPSIELIKRHVELPQVEWIWFEPPNVKLIQGKKYLAWITPVGMGNEVSGYFSIVRMGSSNGVSLFEQGELAIWNKQNPDDSVDAMSRENWGTDRIGSAPPPSLHFKMHFLSRN